MCFSIMASSCFEAAAAAAAVERCERRRQKLYTGIACCCGFEGRLRAPQLFHFGKLKAAAAAAAVTAEIAVV